MKIGIIGGGILGLSLAHYLQQRRHDVHLYEKSPFLGGLACSFDYGSFIWDKFYHVILPRDGHLIGLLGELGLGKDLRWRDTRTGYYAGGRFYSMSGTGEMLRFPLLGWSDKLRMALAMLYTLKIARPEPLYRISAGDWLVRIYGRSNYANFWRPLLRARFGAYAEDVAAIYIWAVLRRLFGARRAVTSRESMGYVHGGYHRILAALREKLEARGGRIYLGAEIERIASAEDGGRCGVVLRSGGGSETHGFDKVVFTAPARAAGAALPERLRPPGEDAGAPAYLGVVCLAVVLRRPLTPYYVVNIADERIPLTGLIEMTGLIDPAEETGGLSLVYLPRYVGAADPFLKAEDGVVYEELFGRGLKRLFPDLAARDVVSWHVQRAPHVQPLPAVRASAPADANANRMPAAGGDVVLANSALLACPTLNNDEVVGLAREIAARF